MKKIIILLCIGITTAKAQQSINTSGGNAAGTGGTVSYSVGQMNHTTNTGTSGSASAGVQQPFEISTVTGLVDSKALNIQLSAFPNPTFDNLILKVESTATKSLSYQLFDLNGKLLTAQKLDGGETKVAMNQYAAATYFLKIIENSNSIKTFKIIKK